MTPREFITKELDIFIEQFPQVRVRYEFHELSNAHFIEVVPNEVYNLDKDYISWELDMDDKFSELYPYEGICFISDDALVGIENAVYAKVGSDYMQLPTAQQESITLDVVTLMARQSVISEISIAFTENSHNVEPIQIPKEYTRLLPKECKNSFYSLAA